MGRVALKYGLWAIGLYFVSAYSTGWGTVIDKGSAGGANVVKAFQGRS